MMINGHSDVTNTDWYGCRKSKIKHIKALDGYDVNQKTFTEMETFL